MGNPNPFSNTCCLVSRVKAMQSNQCNVDSPNISIIPLHKLLYGEVIRNPRVLIQVQDRVSQKK